VSDPEEVIVVVSLFVFTQHSVSRKQRTLAYIVFGSGANHTRLPALRISYVNVECTKEKKTAASFMCESVSKKAFYAVLLPFETSFSCPFV
jgi:hypothetical protein